MAGSGFTRSGLEVPWWPAVVLSLVALIDRIETALVAGVLPQLQAEWGFGDAAAGALPAAVAVTGILVTLPAGYLADRNQRVPLMAAIVAIWSVVTIGSAAAPAFAVFFLTRVGLGGADSLDTPLASSLMADFYPTQQRAKAYGMHRFAFFAGTPVGILVGGLFAQLFGWRSAFLVVAVPGLLVALLVWRLREPVRGGMDATGPLAAPAAPGFRALLAQLRLLLRIRTLRFVFAGLGSLFLGLSGIFFWLPSFFQRVHGSGEAAAGAITAGITLVGVASGAWLGGTLGDRFHGQRPGWRVVLGGGGLLAGSTVLLAAFAVSGLAARALLLTVSVFLLSIAIPNLTAAIADLLPASDRGIGFAVLQLVVTIGFALGPLTVGIIADAAGSLHTAMYALVGPVMLGAICVLIGRTSFDADVRSVTDSQASPLSDSDDDPVGGQV